MGPLGRSLGVRWRPFSRLCGLPCHPCAVYWCPVAPVWSPLVTLWPPLASLVCPPVFPSHAIWALVASIGLSLDPCGVHWCPFGDLVNSIGAPLVTLWPPVPCWPSLRPASVFPCSPHDRREGLLCPRSSTSGCPPHNSLKYDVCSPAYVPQEDRGTRAGGN